MCRVERCIGRTKQVKIQRANLDGTNVQDLATEFLGPFGLALAIPPDLPLVKADTNQDGQVNIVDLLLVVSTLGDTVPALLFADVNGDDRVTIDDVLLVIEALDDPVTAAALANGGEVVMLEAHLNRLRLQSDGVAQIPTGNRFFPKSVSLHRPARSNGTVTKLPQPVQPGDVDTVSSRPRCGCYPYDL